MFIHIGWTLLKVIEPVKTFAGTIYSPETKSPTIMCLTCKIMMQHIT